MAVVAKRVFHVEDSLEISTVLELASLASM